MDSRRKNPKPTTSLNKVSRSESRRKTIRPATRWTGRVILPQAVSRLRVNLRRQAGRAKKPSLTNIAQRLIDSRSPSQGPNGLIYAVLEIPPLQTADSVVAALNATVTALKQKPEPGPESPAAAWDNADDLLPLFDRPPTPATPPAPSQDTSTFTGPLLDLPPFPDSNGSPTQAAVPVFRGSLIDAPDLPEVPVAAPYEAVSASVDDFPLAHSFGPATLWAPLLPAPTDLEFPPGAEHLSLVPGSRYPPFRTGRQQTQPHVTRNAGTRDLRSRAATLPELAVVPPQRTPTCLRVGSPIAGPATAKQPLAQDSLKLRIPQKVKKEDLPRPLHPGHTTSGFSPGLSTEMDCLLSAVDEVKKDFNHELAPLDPDLGNFPCQFPSVVSREPSRIRRNDTQSKKSDKGKPPSPGSGFVSNDLASTPQTFNTQTTPTSRSSFETDRSSRSSYATRTLPPVPLAPEPMSQCRHRTSSNFAVSNATLKALLAAEDASNNTAKERAEGFATSRLTKRSAVVVQEFSDFTHRSFFHPPQDSRSRSDGTLWPSSPSQDRAAASSCGKARSKSVDSLTVRKKKGRGIVFAEWVTSK